MVEDLDVHAVASALKVSIGLFVRRLRQSSVQDDLSLPEMSALSRLERAGSATTSDLARVDQITPQAMGATLAALRNTRSAQTEQLAKALASGFSPAEVETLRVAATLIERLGESL